MTKNSPTISICTIVKNEESNIDEFFGNVLNFADEIIVVDTGSIDGTINKIEKFLSNGKINFFQLNLSKDFHYGKAKNFAIKKAKKDFVLVLDADEHLSDGFKKDIRVFLQKNDPDVVNILRIDELVPHLRERHERIVKNRLNIFYGEDDESMLHEQLIHQRKVMDFNESIWHQQKNNHWLNRPQRILFQMGLEIERTPKTKSFFGHFLRGIWAFGFKFKKVYFRQQVYKDGWTGLKFAFLRAFYAFLVQIFVGLKPGR